jgi:polar amino acid transport system permease protein
LLRGLRNTLLLGSAVSRSAVWRGFSFALCGFTARSRSGLRPSYIDVFRAPPILVAILIYYALPSLGIRFSSFVSATLALVGSAAFTAEVCWAGIENIPNGQFEAAAALGLPFWLALRRLSCRRQSACHS